MRQPLHGAARGQARFAGSVEHIGVTCHHTDKIGAIAGRIRDHVVTLRHHVDKPIGLRGRADRPSTLGLGDAGLVDRHQFVPRHARLELTRKLSKPDTHRLRVAELVVQTTRIATNHPHGAHRVHSHSIVAGGLLLMS